MGINQKVKQIEILYIVLMFFSQELNLMTTKLCPIDKAKTVYQSLEYVFNYNLFCLISKKYRLKQECKLLGLNENC